MTPDKTSSAATTSELLARLQRHYIDPSRDTPGGVFITEVGSNGSTAIATRCDALYIGFTTASQRILVGHELKISRSDWLAEIGRKTGKADAWADQCHQWYIVVPHSSIVHDGELPDGWGLMTPGRGNRMAVHTPAAIKTDHTPSWDAVRSIFARYDTLRAQALIAGDAERMAKAHEKARKQAAQAFQLRLDAERGPEAAAVAKHIPLPSLSEGQSIVIRMNVRTMGFFKDPTAFADERRCLLGVTPVLARAGGRFLVEALPWPSRCD